MDCDKIICCSYCFAVQVNGYVFACRNCNRCGECDVVIENDCAAVFDSRSKLVACACRSAFNNRIPNVAVCLCFGDDCVAFCNEVCACAFSLAVCRIEVYKRTALDSDLCRAVLVS